MKKIPDNAKKVFEGVFFSVWQWDQELFDGSTKTFEYVERPNGSTVIPITKEGKIIIIEQQQPTEDTFFCFPGGGQEPDETPHMCAERELLEETSYKAGTIELWFTLEAEHRVVCNFSVFIGKNCERVSPISQDPGEKIVVHEISLDELMNRIEETNFKSTAVLPYLLKAKYSEVEKEKLKKLFGIT